MIGYERVVREWDTAHGGSWLGAALRPLSLAYGAIVATRGALYDRGLLPADRASIPVVSVGNITVGGTGKTPLVRWIIQSLIDAGRRPAVVLRGYGGDETRLHRRWYPAVPVVEAPRRISGVGLAAQQGADIVVLDDAFQHRSIHRDLDVVLVSADDQRTVRPLPSGPYRESLQALKRADLIIITKKGRRPGQATAATDWLAAQRSTPGFPPVHEATLGISGWSGLDGQRREPPTAPPLVVAGVGAPDTVLNLATEALGGADPGLELVSFPDHHAYSAADVSDILARAGTRPIVTTEKDATKLATFSDLAGPTYVMEMRVAELTEESALRDQLLQIRNR